MSDSPSTADRTTPAEIIGRMAGEYRLRRKLGEGGFGAVYEAEHPVLKRRAAVKVLHRAAGRDSEAVLRFISEAQAANQIRSQNIIDIFSFGRLPDGRHFYVMDLLEGEPLDRCLAREVRLGVAATLQLLRPIAEALDAAHAAGVVHRDLKPQNVFLTWNHHGDTVPKLLDFGMAKLLGDSPVRTLSGTPMGTPLYMSPEQARGDPVDGRSDVYALGVLTHELLTGRLPITGDSTIVVLMAHILQPPPRISEVCPDLPAALDEPILRMLDKDPGARPARAGAALDDLVAAAERAGFVIPPGMPRLRRPIARSPSTDTGELATTPTEPIDAAGGRQHGDGGHHAGGTTEPEPAARISPPSTAPSAPRRTRLGWLGLGSVVALGLGTAYFAGGHMRARPPLPLPVPPTPRVVPEPPPSTLSPPALPASHPAATDTSSISSGGTTRPGPHVELTVDGAPRGARVSLDGRSIGEVPGVISLPFGEARVRLTVSAAGYESATIEVVPDQARAVTAKLKRRPDRLPRQVPIPRDLESPF